uniref:NLR family, CARD domain containing 3-like n=1 Tax=Scophthalmus maximus TaxID=52904 RepID=A0A8D3BBZ2_SCOMX
MEPDTEVESNLRQPNDDEEEEEEEEEKRWKRPPSSYGSMKSDSVEMEEEEEEGNEGDVAVMLPVSTVHGATGLQLIRSESPETLYTMTTQQVPPGADVIDTRSADPEDFSQSDLEDMDKVSIINSPELPEPVEPDDVMQIDENNQPGRLHPEQDLPHIFKSIQKSLTNLTSEELFKFKMWFLQCEPGLNRQQVMEGDILDFVDRMLENVGQDRALLLTISTLEMIDQKPEAEELRNQCKRACFRSHLKQWLIRKHLVIHEGVVRAGRQNLLDNIYVEPQISTRIYGGVDPSHEFQPRLPSPLQVPSPDTFVGVNNLFRLQADGGRPVRTVLTTGIPGIGMSVSVGKFCLDWAEQRANKDLQYVIKLSFCTFWFLRNHIHPPPHKSIMEVIEYCQHDCKGINLEQEDCKFLIIMDSFDCYQAPLDWENAPVINDNHMQAHPDVLIVNIIRGTVLRGACIWILGRQGAVSQIPSQYIDVVTEIQGFSDEMKDDYLTRRFSNPELAAKIVAHYKRLPTLRILARQPFLCWMVATVFERCYRYQGYGVHPPRLTPFYVNIVIVQTNRRLQFYHGKSENDLKWSSNDKHQLTKMGNMAFKMIDRRTSVFFEEDVKECGLKLTEVAVLSGLCTELPAAVSDGRRTFCFIHFTVQEFMAAFYIFTKFYMESKNVLDSGYSHLPRIFTAMFQKSNQTKAANLVQCALVRTFSSPLGDFDMVLRFLCGLLCPGCHIGQLSGFLYCHKTPKVGGLDEVQQLLEHTIQTAPEDRVENLRECLREMTQEDE